MKVINPVITKTGLAEAMATFRLSPAELDVLHLLMSGLSTHEISQRRFTSHKTARNQIWHILKKVDCRDRGQLVALAFSESIKVILSYIEEPLNEGGKDDA